MISFNKKSKQIMHIVYIQNYTYEYFKESII